MNHTDWELVKEDANISADAFQRVAIKILKEQKKLGKLRGISVKTLSLDESRKDRLRKAGLITTSLISLGALGFGLKKLDQAGKLDGLAKGIGHTAARVAKSAPAGKLVSGASTFKGGAITQGQRLADSRAGKFVSGQAKAIADSRAGHFVRSNTASGVAMAKKGVAASNKFASNNRAALKTAGTTLAAGTAVGAAARAMNQRSIVIEAKYQYGSKMFEVAHVSAGDANIGVDRHVLKEVNTQISKLKTQDWVIRESVTELTIQNKLISEALLESVMEESL